MDPSLLKGLNAFKKKSLATPVIESRRNVKTDPNNVQKERTRAKKRRPDLPPQLLQQAKKQATSQIVNYKIHTQIKQKSRFSILSSIVDLLKSKYQKRDFQVYTLEQLLDLTHNTDIKDHNKQWLAEALKDNPKIAFKDIHYSFKPKYALRDRKSLVRLLEKHEQNGLGGVLLDDIREGLPNADEIIKAVSDKVTFVTRSNDKKAILFYYDSSFHSQVDEEFQKHWRSVAVEGLAEADIERYLNSSGITSMQGVAPTHKRHEKKRGNKRRKNMKLMNTHLEGDMLKDYSEPGKR